MGSAIIYRGEVGEIACFDIDPYLRGTTEDLRRNHK